MLLGGVPSLFGQPNTGKELDRGKGSVPGEIRGHPCCLCRKRAKVGETTLRCAAASLDAISIGNAASSKARGALDQHRCSVFQKWLSESSFLLRVASPVQRREILLGPLFGPHTW